MDAHSSVFVCSARIAAPPEKSFGLFTSQIGQWWPTQDRSSGRPPRNITIEPRTNGRFFESRAGKADELWGTVVAYVPWQTLVIDLQLDPEFAPAAGPKTSLELFFVKQKDASTHLTLVHADLNHFGADAAGARQRFAAGWRDILGAFQAFAGAGARDSVSRSRRCPDAPLRRVRGHGLY